MTGVNRVCKGWHPSLHLHFVIWNGNFSFIKCSLFRLWREFQVNWNGGDTYQWKVNFERFVKEQLSSNRSHLRVTAALDSEGHSTVVKPGRRTIHQAGAGRTESPSIDQVHASDFWMLLAAMSTWSEYRRDVRRESGGMLRQYWLQHSGWDKGSWGRSSR